MEWEKIIFSVYMAASAYHVTAKEAENHIMNRIAFFDTDASINNPFWQNSEIIFLCKYFLSMIHWKALVFPVA